MIARAGLFDSIPSVVPADIGYDILPRLGGKIFAHPISEYLLDIGTLENYRLAQTGWAGIA